ncbi:MAG: CsgG/HfaB family protein, partial [Phycisphaerae bacterium]|nr:CsgG/HfaB family protein [Phycisphaerae bacterium]
MKNALRFLSVLAILSAVMLLSVQCRRSTTTTTTSTQPDSAAVTPAPGGGDVISVGGPPTTEPDVAPAAATAATLDLAKKAHEQSAILAVDDIKAMLATKDYAKAKDAATLASKDYADTLVAGEFAPLLKQADDGLAAAPPKVDVASLPDTEKAARHDRFVQSRDAGLAAIEKQDYPTAVTSFQAALREEDDPETRDLMAQASAMTGKPRLGVTTFAVSGDVGITEAGKSVPELLLSRFDPKRFQLIERTRLASLLQEQDLSVSQITENPTILRVKKLLAVRYLVVGAVVRIDTLVVSGRLVDAATGEVIQTAEITARDANGLQAGLAELALMLQMTNDEKAQYLLFRQRQMEAMAAEDAANRAAAEEQRLADLAAEQDRIARLQAAQFQAQQHERDAFVALADIKTLYSRGDFLGAKRLARWAVREFADTVAARELGDLLTAAEFEYQRQVEAQRDANGWSRYQAELAARHQRFLRFRQDGLAAMANRDWDTAAAAFQQALREEDNPNVRALLDQVTRRTQCPGLAVADFDVNVDLGMRDAERSLAIFMLSQFGGDGRVRLIDCDQFAAVMNRLGITPADIVRDPGSPRVRRLAGFVRYVVIGSARRGSIRLETTLFDVQAGQAVQRAVATANRPRELQQTLAEMSRVLLMTDADKRDYMGRQAYTDWMNKAAAFAAAGRWDDAQDAYSRAYAIQRAPEALAGMTEMARRQRDGQEMKRRYDKAMADADAAIRRGDWAEAFDAYQKAAGILNTPDAQSGLTAMRKKLGESNRDTQRLYDRLMADGDAAGAKGDWAKALEAYQRAFDLSDTPDAKACVALARQNLAQQQQGRKRDYDRLIADAKAAVRAGDWQKAIDLYSRAGEIDNTNEVRAGLTLAKRKLADNQANRRLYDSAMADAKAAMQAGQWQRAIDAYLKAGQIDNTPEVKSGLAAARDKLANAADAQSRQKNYDDAMRDADAFAKAGQWAKALDAYTRAARINNTREAQAGITLAKQKLDEATGNQNKKREFDRLLAQANAAAR